MKKSLWNNVQHHSKMKKKKKNWNVHIIDGAHLQYANNHYAKFEWKGMKTFGVTDYTNLVPLKCCGRTKMSKFNTPQKWKKNIKHAQNRRCTFSICEQSLGKVWMKRNENFWSYRLHKFGTPKVLRMDGRMDGQSGPTTGQTCFR